ncbi:MAG: class E sortase [Anaerosomatales bacterium]|nr:class E sortase [Anaerosomatales bacterium]
MSSTTEPEVARLRPSRRVFVARLASDCLFGIALGLVAYYGVTDALAARSQQLLRAEAPRMAAATVADDGAAAFDFSAWDKDKVYWASLGSGEPFGRIACEAIGLDAVVVKGVAPRDLVRGPGWAPYTDVPGPQGNCGISGHRTTYGAPFRRLDKLKAGDVVTLVGPYTTFRYEVERVFVVRPEQVEVFATTEEPSLTLTACHPPYSARYRIVVRAKMVAAAPNERDE